jgi:hypothetical protein
MNSIAQELRDPNCSIAYVGVCLFSCEMPSFRHSNMALDRGVIG